MKIAFAKFNLLFLSILQACSSAAASNPPQRHYFSEEQLRLICVPKLETKESADLARALCQNYVLGVVDGHEAWTGITKNSKRAFCLPEGTFNAQITDAVVVNLTEKPRNNSGIGAFLVLEGLHKAFPCQAEKK